ncbi:uncharacterized protein LOC113377286 [Ctenocephalides felis]|uniref:uncharacterized protein LOC113377286 n=1 Tax=Ctenocephalides felis TaxID=7515 RepID=UPI000E6E12E7|nr:uncharacterized protein LOC113377286 [Ctenocephalides felis]
MNSNLPLLFANGFPTSIENATVSQLQRFIPFLVKCSVGRDSPSFTMPRWWPEAFPMITPDFEPVWEENDWLKFLRDLVISCYKFHDSEYLLHFCNNLTSHPRSTLRYINNFNGTTSLYVKGEGRLLCTFRNENITYDKKEEDSRKCLKPRIINAIKILDDDNDDEMVTTEAIDIFICENCNTELDCLSDLHTHELVCENKDIEVNVYNSVTDRSNPNLLNYLKLHSINDAEKPNIQVSSSPVKQPLILTHRTRNRAEMKQLRDIPFSSPAGKVLHQKLKLGIDKATLNEKLTKVEKSCPAPNINEEVPKYLTNTKNKTFKVSYREKLKMHSRYYTFPFGPFWTKRSNNFVDTPVLVDRKDDQADDYSAYKIHDNSAYKTDDNSAFKIHDNYAYKMDENSAYKIDDNSAYKTDDNSAFKIHDNFAYKMDDDSAYKIEDNSYDNSNEVKPLVKVDCVINLCSSDEEDNLAEIEMEQEDPISLEPTPLLPLNNSNDDYAKIIPLSLVCKNDDVESFLPVTNMFKAPLGVCDFIDLCSSDEETILPDLPNHPHLSIVRIPAKLTL